MKCTDTSTGWSFDCVTDSSGRPPAGGLVLQNITHDGHNFAKDVRLIGLWIETETVDVDKSVATGTKKFYALDAANFTVSAVKTLTPLPPGAPPYKSAFAYLKEADAGLQFTDYFKDGGNYLTYGVSAKFDAPTLLSALDNCEYAGLAAEQIFLFSRYGKLPIHEPSGGLEAARCHPMVRYLFSKNGAHDATKKYTRVRTIRFDYRLYLYLDRLYNIPNDAAHPGSGNQAAMFADRDSSKASKLVGFGSGVKGFFTPGADSVARGTTGAVFTSAEKPVVLEVMLPGLGKGFAKFQVAASGGGSPVDVRAWDNVHWWGSRGPKDPIISAPGAFHCAHLHWRWGAASGQASKTPLGPVFDPVTYPKGMPANPAVDGMWGPLVDPAIWIQTLRLAITKNDPKIDPAAGLPPSALSKEDWASLFDPGLHATPLDISAGADLVLWYSTQVHRDLSEPSAPSGSPYANPKVPGLGSPVTAPGGTVFIHGIFFAHSAEIAKFGVGTTEPVYFGDDAASIKKAKAWTRPAT